MSRRRNGPRPPKPPNAVQRQGLRRTKPNIDADLNLSNWLRPLTAALNAQGGLTFFRTDIDDAMTVITATSVLDDLLKILIIFHAGRVPSTAHAARMFDYPGPLASFSAKIDLCFLMGKLLPDMRFDLDIIRNIRNDFCHTLVMNSFEDPAVKLKCAKLRTHQTYIDDEKLQSLMQLYGSHELTAKKEFCKTVLMLIILILAMIVRRFSEIKILSGHSEEINQMTTGIFDNFFSGLKARAEAEQENETSGPALSEIARESA